MHSRARLTISATPTRPLRSSPTPTALPSSMDGLSPTPQKRLRTEMAGSRRALGLLRKAATGHRGGRCGRPHWCMAVLVVQTGGRQGSGRLPSRARPSRCSQCKRHRIRRHVRSSNKHLCQSGPSRLLRRLHRPPSSCPSLHLWLCPRSRLHRQVEPHDGRRRALLHLQRRSQHLQQS